MPHPRAGGWAASGCVGGTRIRLKNAKAWQLTQCDLLERPVWGVVHATRYAARAYWHNIGLGMLWFLVLSESVERWSMLETTRAMIRQVVDNRSAIRRDVLLSLAHLPDLPHVLSPLRAEPSIHSELDPHSYSSWSDVCLSLLQVAIPGDRRSCSTGTLAVRPARVAEEAHSSRWFFINGIATPPPVALVNATEIANVFQRTVHLIHNPTMGLVRDLGDLFTARTLRKDGRLSRPAFYVVHEALKKNERVVLFCHSHGTIVASYIVRKLLRNTETRHLVKKLEIYCMGGVADSLEVDAQLTREAGHPVPYVEHFANGRDYFAQIGILSHLDSTAGNVFCLPDRKGHLLNDHYLAGIVRGDYCGRSSRLYHYARGKEPEDSDYILSPAREEEA